MTATKRKDPRALKLAALFAEAAKRGISADQLRNEIAPRELGRRLSEACQAELSVLLRYIAGQEPPRPSSPYRSRYEDLGFRDGMATPRQLRRIEAMWMGVSIAPDRASREKALKGFLKRLTGVEDLRFLESWMVQKVINALEHMDMKLPAQGGRP